MFIIWKGLGVIAILIPIILMFIVQGITNSIFGDGYYQNSNWTLASVLIISAVIIYFIGVKLNNKEGQIVIDKETNEEIELKKTHSLFWIPLQYWGFIMFGLGIWAFISKLN